MEGEMEGEVEGDEATEVVGIDMEAMVGNQRKQAQI